MPSFEQEVLRVRDGDIGEHGPKDSHDLTLDLVIRERLNTNGVIALQSNDKQIREGNVIARLR